MCWFNNKKKTHGLLMQIIYTQFTLERRINSIMVEFDRVKASLVGLQASVDAAVAKLDALKVNAVDPVEMTAVADGLDAAKSKLDAAVA